MQDHHASVPVHAAERHRICDDLRGGDPGHLAGTFGLDLLMDHGWLVTYGNAEKMTVQLGIAREGGSATAVPDLSIEVDDVDAALAAMKKAGLRIEYGRADEPRQVRRFFIRDPFGRLVNILAQQ